MDSWWNQFWTFHLHCLPQNLKESMVLAVMVSYRNLSSFHRRRPGLVKPRKIFLPAASRLYRFARRSALLQIRQEDFLRIPKISDFRSRSNEWEGLLHTSPSRETEHCYLEAS